MRYLMPLPTVFQYIPGLKAFWPFTSIGDGAAAFIDMSGQGRTLSIGNGPIQQYNVDPTGFIVANAFNGSDDYLYRASEAGLSFTGTMSLGCWVYLDSIPGGTVDFFTKSGASGNYGYGLQLNVGKPQFFISTDGTAKKSATAAYALTAQTWNFVVGRFNPSGSVDVYVNGVKASNTDSIPASIHASSAALNLGGNSVTGTYMPGRITWPWLSVEAMSDALVTVLADHCVKIFRP